LAFPGASVCILPDETNPPTATQCHPGKVENRDSRRGLVSTKTSLMGLLAKFMRNGYKEPILSGGVRGEKIIITERHSKDFAGGCNGSAHEKWTRIPHNEEPDFTRPLLEILTETEERMLSRLGFLYGKDEAQKWLPRIKKDFEGLLHPRDLLMASSDILAEDKAGAGI